MLYATRPLYELSARDAVNAMVTGDIRPIEYLDSVLARIEATESAIQAWECIDADGARRQAAKLSRMSTRDRSERALYGVPVGLKDVIKVQGLPTKAGIVPYSALVADEDAGVTKLLRDAGAVVLGKTVTTQFACSMDEPKTRNPWNQDHTPEGQRVDPQLPLRRGRCQ